MKTTTSFKLDSKIKSSAAKLAGLLGLSLSTVVNESLREFVKAQKITFSVHPELNAKTKKELLARSKDAHAGKNLVGPFSSTAELMKSLRG